MIPVFIDVETSGLNPVKHQALQVGIIISDEEFEVTIDRDDEVVESDGYDVIAFEINGLNRKTIIAGLPLLSAKIMIEEFLNRHHVNAKTHMIVGINVGFDKSFMEQDLGIEVPYRNIDLSTIARFHRGVGGSDVISKSFGVPAETKPHKALAGARQHKLIYEAMQRELL